MKIADAGGPGGPTDGFGHNIVTSGSDVLVAFTVADVTHAEAQISLAWSHDGGSTWRQSVLVSRSPAYNPNGAAVAIGPDPLVQGGQRVHVVWGQVGTPSSILYAHAPLSATSLGPFSAPVVVSGTLNCDSGLHEIVADGSGNVHMAFAAEVPNVYYTRSSDGGETFAEVGTLIASGDYPGLAIDAAGDVALAFNRSDGAAALALRLAGGSWGPVLAVPGINPPGSVRILDANHVWIASTPIGNSSAAVVVSSTDGGTSWTTAVVANERPSSGSLAVNPAGALSFAWLFFDPANNWVPSIRASRSIDGAHTWSAPATAMSFTSDDDVKLVNTGIDSTGMLLIDATVNQTVALTREK